jgi:PncC family amidohydrolase
MGAGVRRALGTDVGCAITGIAGPGGGSDEKPVGLVWCAVETPDGLFMRRLTSPGSRPEVRRRAVLATMGLLLGAVRGDLAPEAS